MKQFRKLLFVEWSCLGEGELAFCVRIALRSGSLLGGKEVEESFASTARVLFFFVVDVVMTSATGLARCGPTTTSKNGRQSHSLIVFPPGSRPPPAATARRKANRRVATMPKQTKPEPIVFDANARKEYLTGFSQRKQARRLYGLAMQKVKNRKAKLTQRAERRDKEAELDQAIRAVDQLQQDTDKNKEDEDATKTVHCYQDDQTQERWGRNVIVTTSACLPSDRDRDLDEPIEKQQTDSAQEYAGSVDKYLAQLRAKNPSKKSNANTKRKGQHGAMGSHTSAKDFKEAQKLLKRQKSNKSNSRKKRRKR